MKPLTEQEIRAAFVNCSKGEASRLNVPRNLSELPWEDLDFLGWRDPQAPDRAYFAAALDERLVAVALRSTTAASWQARRSICSLCVTPQTGNVALLVAPRAGQAGKQGNSVGAYMCADLACSLYIRGKKDNGTRFHESLTEEEKVERLLGNLAEFVGKVTA